jgi:hypothetical protein
MRAHSCWDTGSMFLEALEAWTTEHREQLAASGVEVVLGRRNGDAEAGAMADSAQAGARSRAWPLGIG